MPLWIPITIAAAFLQNLRSTLQKHLKGVMGTTGATFVRFGFGFPFALFFLWFLNQIMGYPMPAMSALFLGWAVVGGLAQIGGTFLLVHLFSFRNFAVGTAYSRTEPAQAALFGLLFLGETVTPGVAFSDRREHFRRHADFGCAEPISRGVPSSPRSAAAQP